MPRGCGWRRAPLAGTERDPPPLLRGPLRTRQPPRDRPEKKGIRRGACRQQLGQTEATHVHAHVHNWALEQCSQLQMRPWLTNIVDRHKVTDKLLIKVRAEKEHASGGPGQEVRRAVLITLTISF